MKSIARFYIAFILTLTSVIAIAQSARQPFQLTDLRKLVSLSSPRISPDGSRIAVVVSKSDWEKDKSKQEIDLVNVMDGSTRSLTFEREDISNLSWSPDGGKLAFIANDGESKKPQIFVMPMNGGDAVKVTDSNTGVSEFTWSPDGQKIAFVAQDTVPNAKAIEHHEDVFQVTDNNYTVHEALQPWHIWIVSLNGDSVKRLTAGSWSLCTDQETISPLAWNPDGKSITFQRFPDVWEGNAWHCTIAEVDTNGGEVRTVVKDEGSGSPDYSLTTTALAFMRPRNGDQNNGSAVYLNVDGKSIDVTNELDRNIISYVWLPDGKELLLTGEKGTQSVMWRQPVDGRAEQLDLGDVNPSEENASVSNSGAVAFIGNTSMHPPELYVLDSVNGRPRRLTNFNGFVDSLALGKAENVDWKGPDGFDEDGVLIYPVGYEAGKKYPLVLDIHGGPEGTSVVAFAPLPQLLAGKGFFVFEPNYRGSTNLGDAYQHAIFRDTGKGPGKDVMAGLAKVEQLGMIDTNRIGISGWSYGGYMTSWLNGNYPDKWKAAIEGAALNDWVMDYTIAYYQTGDIYFFGGSPWVKDYWKIWREQSPIEFARNVKAPTLILCDVGDPNVPIINSYEMYHALRDNGVHTEFYAYPADTHFPHDIVRTTDVYKRWIDWMEKYLK
ncbi:MAG: S9 family peptidase [Candidatus Kryptoniota bacterium]